jgi:anthranilate phosphoribosyltransferase
MIKEAISKAMNKENLTREEALQVMKEIMSGEAEQSQVAAFLVALHMKGETAEEISACAEGMRSFATKLDRGDMDVIDIVGTGGDRSNTFNISTTAAIVTAAAGKCGTADCLETLGVNLMLEPEKNAKVLKDTNLCFLFAQKYHPAMRYVGPVRKAIGVPTVFNILGPLTNPAYNTYQLLGVYSEELLETVANALKDLGLKHAMVVYGKDCLDEISMSADTEVCELADGKVTKYTITPEQFGFTRCRKEDLVGGTPEENAALVKEILEGKVTGAKLDAVLINAGAAIHVAKNVSMEEGIKEAREMITSGKALATMEQFIAETNAA